MILAGVKQGCALLPLRFAVVLNVIMSEVDFELEIKIKIIKTMRINNTKTDNTMLQGQSVDYFGNFCYHDSIITTNAGAETEVMNRRN